MKRSSIALLALALACVPIYAADVAVASFNAEFLTRPKVHMKFGFPFNLSGTDATTWHGPGFPDQRFATAATAVAQVIANIDADVVALTEVGDAADITELNSLVAAVGSCEAGSRTPV